MPLVDARKLCVSILVFVCHACASVCIIFQTIYMLYALCIIMNICAKCIIPNFNYGFTQANRRPNLLVETLHATLLLQQIKYRSAECLCPSLARSFASFSFKFFFVVFARNISDQMNKSDKSKF